MSRDSNGNGFMVQWDGRDLYVTPEDVESLLRAYGGVVLRPIKRLEEDRPFTGPEHVVMHAMKRAEEKEKSNQRGGTNEDA